MKIRIRSRQWIERAILRDADFIKGKWIISIFSKGDISPIEDRFNVLKLNFDDVTEQDTEIGLIHFDEGLADKVIEFIKGIKEDGKEIYVHCDAGVSRSGAIGYMLNEWFNKYLSRREEDLEFFTRENGHIMPNPEVMRVMKRKMFGNDYSGVFVNDYEYNEDGERIDHIKEI